MSAILIADKSPSLRKLFEFSFGEEYQLHFADTDEEVLQALDQDDPPVLAFVDSEFADDEEALQQLVDGMAAQRSIPVVLLRSAFSETGEIQGIARELDKPFDAEDLEACLDELASAPEEADDMFAEMQSAGSGTDEEVSAEIGDLFKSSDDSATEDEDADKADESATEGEDASTEDDFDPGDIDDDLLAELESQSHDLDKAEPDAGADTGDDDASEDSEQADDDFGDLDLDDLEQTLSDADSVDLADADQDSAGDEEDNEDEHASADEPGPEPELTEDESRDSNDESAESPDADDLSEEPQAESGGEAPQYDDETLETISSFEELARSDREDMPPTTARIQSDSGLPDPDELLGSDVGADEPDSDDDDFDAHEYSGISDHESPLLDDIPDTADEEPARPDDSASQGSRQPASQPAMGPFEPRIEINPRVELGEVRVDIPPDYAPQVHFPKPEGPFTELRLQIDSEQVEELVRNNLRQVLQEMVDDQLRELLPEIAREVVREELDRIKKIKVDKS